MSEQRASDKTDNQLLTGWKAIAARFGRDERTIRRWAATKDLPVRRVAGESRGPVFAYAADLDRWLVGHREVAFEQEHEATPAAAGPDPVEIVPAPEVIFSAPEPATSNPSRPRLRMPQLAAVCVLAGLVAVLLWRSNSGAVRSVLDAPVSSAESFYLDGQYHLETRTNDGMTRAIGLFSQAIAVDPGFTKAYVGLADAYNLISQYTPASAAESYPKARSAAERAIALDAGNAAAHAALAFNAFYGNRDVDRAITLFRKAIELDPGNARAHHWYALVAMQNRDFDVAIRHIGIAQRLDPRAPAILANKGLILFHAGQTDAALDILRPLAETQPSLLSPHAYLATIFLATSRDTDFLREGRLAAEISRNPTAMGIMDAAKAGYGGGDHTQMLTAMFAEQQRQYAEDREPAFKLALTAAMLGDKAAALDFLDQSIRRREPNILGIRLEPALVGLRDDSRFVAMVKQAGFVR